MEIAVLDDYQKVALEMADWSAIMKRATVTVFNDYVADADTLVDRLQPFDVICVMRERTPLNRAILSRLPKAAPHRVDRSSQLVDRHRSHG